jgi:hypothetical protein
MNIGNYGMSSSELPVLVLNIYVLLKDIGVEVLGMPTYDVSDGDITENGCSYGLPSSTTVGLGSNVNS